MAATTAATVTAAAPVASAGAAAAPAAAAPAPATAGTAPSAFEDAAARALYVPIAYGTISFAFMKRPAPGESTHKWSVYVRHAEGRDLSFAVSKVVFTLHPTVARHVRVVTAEPFEVCETGWGEFDIRIDIHVRHAAEPLTVYQKLKLYVPSTAMQTVERPVVDEHYDEIVFNALPSDKAALLPLLRGVHGEPAGAAGASSSSASASSGAGASVLSRYSYHEYMTPLFSAEEDLTRVAAARIRVAEETRNLEERLLIRQREVAAMKAELRALGVL